MCAAFVSRHLPGGRLWHGGVRLRPWVGFVPPLPPLWFLSFFFFCRGGCRGVSCGGLVMSVAGCPGLGSRAHRPPFHFSFGLRLLVFFFPSPPQGGVCWRVRGVFSSSWPLVSIWCRRFWLGGPPVFLRGVLSPVPSGWGVWLSLVGGQFCGCVPFSCPPPFFFGGGSLRVPPSAFPGLVHALVGIRCGLPGCCWRLRFARPCPAPWVGWVMYTLGSVALLAGLGSGSAGWAGAPSGFLRPWVRGAEVSRVSPPPRCRYSLSDGGLCGRTATVVAGRAVASCRCLVGCCCAFWVVRPLG